MTATSVPVRPSSSAEDERQCTRRLLERAALTADGRERRRLHDEVAVAHIGVADRLAARYARRGVALEDLQQVARLALVRAVRDFDPARANDFLAYAVPTVRGALKRYFRDSGWAIRPPRRVQEAQAELSHARAALVHDLGREPTVAELAGACGLAEDTVIEALAADSCYSPDSLDWTAQGDDASPSLDAVVGGVDPGFELFETRALVRDVIGSLSERDRRVVTLRFFEGLSQADVGREVGVSQMQVSRILSRILRQLRAVLHER